MQKLPAPPSGFSFWPARWRSRQVWTSLVVGAIVAVPLVNLGGLGGRSAPAGSAVDALRSPAGNVVVQSLEGDAAARLGTLLLDQASRKLAQIPDMSAVFHKRERVEGELQDPMTMEIKVRQAPQSVYMKWREPSAGQEAIWRPDHNDGLILVHAGGWRKKLVPLLKLDPLGDRAMAYSRRPISNIGLWAFTDRLHDVVAKALASGDAKVSLDTGAAIGGKTCYCLKIERKTRPTAETPNKVVVYVDQALELPIACEVYGWPTQPGDKAPLDESYAFSDLKLNIGLTDRDFDIANPSYEYASK